MCPPFSHSHSFRCYAFHAMHHERSEELLQFISNENKCPEKRSHTFRALLKCPDDEILHKLVHRLDDEPSNQLKSLIYTTLSNLGKSSDPKTHSMLHFLITYELVSRFYQRNNRDPGVETSNGHIKLLGTYTNLAKF